MQRQMAVLAMNVFSNPRLRFGRSGLGSIGDRNLPSSVEARLRVAALARKLGEQG